MSAKEAREGAEEGDLAAAAAARTNGGVGGRRREAVQDEPVGEVAWKGVVVAVVVVVVVVGNWMVKHMLRSSRGMGRGLHGEGGEEKVREVEDGHGGCLGVARRRRGLHRAAP